MKTPVSLPICRHWPRWICALAGLSIVGQAQQDRALPSFDAPSKVAVASRSAHERILEQVTLVAEEDGSTRSQTNTVVELATGLHYLDDAGHWADSVEAFELVPGAARAWKGHHRVTLAHNPNTPAAVQHRLPDGRLLSSHVHGVGWYDTATGESVLLAEIADSKGLLVEDNVIVYPDALQGDVLADIRYTYTLSGFEQDIVLRGAPPAPEAFGLSSKTSRLEVWTEFDEPLEPDVRDTRAQSIAAAAPDGDVELDFGSMKIGTGRYFRWGAEDESLGLMVKEWIREDDGRRFLVEAVEYGPIAESLKNLPPSGGGADASKRRRGQRESVLAGLRKARPARPSDGVMQRLDRTRDTALVERLQRPGLVLDYVSLTTGTANHVFKSDVMYWVTGNVILTGTTAFEPGAVIKFSTATTAQVEVQGLVAWLASPLLPVTLTARDDSGFGETAPGQTTPLVQAGYAGSGLRFNGPTTTVLNGLRVRNLRRGLEYVSGSGHVVRHAQFVDVGEAIRLTTGTTVNVRNALVVRASTGVFGGTGASTAVVEHLTVNGADRLAVSGVFASASALTLRNCLINALTNTPPLYTGGSDNVVSTANTVTFASQRGGAHYLPAGSAHLDAGTATVDTTLTTELREMTTEPPRELVGEIAFNTSLRPIAAVDTGILDRGYHYPRIDYAASGVTLTNAVLTLTNGVRLGTYGSVGINLRSGAVVRSGGSPNRMNWLTRLALVQEGITAEPTTTQIFRPFSGTVSPRVEMRFTGVGMAAELDGRRNVVESFTGVPAIWAMKDCALWNVSFLNDNPTSGHSLSFLNNRWHRGCLELDQKTGPEYPLALHNNLWIGGRVGLRSAGATSFWVIRDNLFDVSTNSRPSGTNWTASNNGYRSATSFGGPTNFTITVAEHLTGPLGTNYYPSAGSSSGGFTNLVGAGFRSGTTAGLFHHVIATHLVSIGSGQVGIGFHYLKTSAGGVPLDTDSDGMPDWMEDVNAGMGVRPGTRVLGPLTPPPTGSSPAASHSSARSSRHFQPLFLMKSSKLFPWLVLILSLSVAQRLLGQAGCGCEPAGIRGVVNSTNGIWYGHLPFETSPGQFVLAKVDVRYLKETQRTFGSATHQSTYVQSGTITTYFNGGFQYEFAGAIYHTNTWVYDASSSIEMSRLGVDGTKQFNGSVNRYWSTFDGRTIEVHVVNPRTYCCQEDLINQAETLSGLGNGDGLWNLLNTTSHREYQTAPTPAAWIESGTTNAGTRLVSSIDIPSNLSLLSTTATVKTWKGSWLVSPYVDPVTNTTSLTIPYTKIQLRDELASRLLVTGRQTNIEEVKAAFSISPGRDAGAVQQIDRLEVYVSGEAGRNYLVWYTKTTKLRDGIGSPVELSQKIVGQGPDTLAVVAIPFDPLPPDEGEITYKFNRVELLMQGDTDPDGGEPGAGVFSGVGGGAGGCRACGDSATPGSWGEWSGGTIGYQISMGAGPGGVRAGTLQLIGGDDRPALLQRSALRMSGSGMALDLRQDGGGLRQVLAPRVVADIQTLTNGGFEVRLFAWSSVASTNGALATFVGGAVPHTTWRTEPDIAGLTNGNRVRVTMSQTAGTSKTVIYVADTNAPAGTISWTVIAPGGLYDYISSTCRETDSTYGALRVEQQAWRWPGASTNSFVQRRKSATFPWGEGIVETSVGEGSASPSNRVTYWSGSANRRASGEVALTESWDGSWVAYEYDDEGRTSAEIRPNGSVAPGSGSVRRTEYSYAVVSGSGDYGGSPHARTPRQITERIEGEIFGRSWLVIEPGMRRTIRAATPTATWNHASNRVSRAWHYPNGQPFAGRFWKKQGEDGVLSVYSYATNGTQEVTTVSTGSPNLAGTAIVDGTQTVTTVGSYGEVVSQVSRWITAGSLGSPFASATYSDWDAAGRWRRLDLLDGTYELRTFDCCGLGNDTDRDGVVTQYLYDAAGRALGSTRIGITLTNLLSPAGAILRSVRVGSDGSLVTLGSRGFDTAGQVLAETNALGAVTTFGWFINAGGELVESQTNSYGGTQILTRLRDGRMKSLNGTAVSPRSWTYAWPEEYSNPGNVDPIRMSSVTEATLDDNDAEIERVTTFVDGLGQVRRIDTGNSGISWIGYNRFGQRVREQDPDGVVTLYQYNAEGSAELTAIDVSPNNTTFDSNGNPSIDLAQDRLVRATADSTTQLGQSARRQRVWEYPDAGSTASQEIQTILVTADSRTMWTTDRGQTRTSTLTFDRTNQRRIVTNTAPDGTYTVSVVTAGRPTSVTEYASNGVQLGKKSMLYDPHGRLSQVTDARSGTATLTYNAADQVVSETSSTSGTGHGARITQNIYNNTGHLISTILPDGTSVTNEYHLNGLLKKRSGSRTTPVEYDYDRQGRLKTLRTWKNASTLAGAATTTWVYETGLGLLYWKALPDGSGPTYAYTLGGRPKIRTWVRNWGVTTTYRYGFESGGASSNTSDLVGIDYAGDADLDGSPVTPNLEFEHDRLGRRTSATQSLSGSVVSVATVTRNGLGQVTNESWSVGPHTGRSLSFAYDDRLRRTNVTFRSDSVTNGTIGYGFDGSGRISSIVDGSSSATFAYVANSPLLQQIQLKQGAFTALTVSRQYDRWSRLQAQTAVGGISGSIGQEYTFNSAGQRVRANLMDGSYWVYEYDALGQVRTGRRYWNNGDPVAGQQFEYAYDDVGNRTSNKTGGDLTGGNLRATGYLTDLLNQVGARTNTRYYEVQGAARVSDTIAVNGIAAQRQGEYFRHEASASGVAGALAPNALTVNGTNAVSNRVRYVPRQFESLEYDADGNQTGDGRWNLAWDAENRLVDVRTSDGAVTDGFPQIRVRYRYDADGRLIEREHFVIGIGGWEQTDITRFLYDGWQCIAEYNGAGSLLRRQVWGLDLDSSLGRLGGIGGLLWISSIANGTHFAASDGSGNMVALFGSGGTVSARYEYGPYGELLRLSGDPIAFENPWRFSSKRQDPITDWVHYECRVYDPLAGRWLSRDPIGELDGPNLYSMVQNDPINRVDPFGLEKFNYKGTEICRKPDHHKVPVETWEMFRFDAEAAKLLNSATVEAKNHDNTAHGVKNGYTGEVIDEFIRWYRSEEGRKFCVRDGGLRGVDAAQSFVAHIDSTRNPRIRIFNKFAKEGPARVAEEWAKIQQKSAKKLAFGFPNGLRDLPDRIRLEVLKQLYLEGKGKATIRRVCQASCKVAKRAAGVGLAAAGVGLAAAGVKADAAEALEVSGGEPGPAAVVFVVRQSPWGLVIDGNEVAQELKAKYEAQEWFVDNMKYKCPVVCEDEDVADGLTVEEIFEYNVLGRGLGN